MKTMNSLVRRPPRSAAPSFTLIELLAVITVIVVIVGLLAPSLGKAKATVKRISCANNLRNIIQASMCYAGDNDSWLPECQGAGFATYKLNAYLCQKYKSLFHNAAGDHYSLAFDRPSPVFDCPAVSTSAALHLSSYNGTYQDPTGGKEGGCWTYYDSSSASTTLSRRVESIRYNCVLVLDRFYFASGNVDMGSFGFSGAHTQNWQYSASYPWYAPAFVHDARLCNFAFKDGRVQAWQYTGNQLFDYNYCPLF